MKKRDTAEVANKVRADLNKEKILNQIKETIESGNALNFRNTDDVIVINQKNKPYKRIFKEDLPKAFEWDHPDRGRYYIPKDGWAPKLKKE